MVPQTCTARRMGFAGSNSSQGTNVHSFSCDVLYRQMIWQILHLTVLISQPRLLNHKRKKKASTKFRPNLLVHEQFVPHVFAQIYKAKTMGSPHFTPWHFTVYRHFIEYFSYINVSPLCLLYRSFICVSDTGIRKRWTIIYHALRTEYSPASL